MGRVTRAAQLRFAADADLAFARPAQLKPGTLGRPEMKDSARVVELTVETVSEIRGRVYVLARASEDDSPILVTSRSTLDGVPVEPWLDVPRSLDPSGAPRTNLVAFCLRFAPDQARFR